MKLRKFLYLKSDSKTSCLFPDTISHCKHSFGNERLKTRVVSSVGLEHLPYKQGVIGSNPIPPTSLDKIITGQLWIRAVLFYLKSIMYYVYMLYSAVVDRYYVGQTSNLEDRLKRHNQGRSKYTKSGIPWNLVYKESFETRSESMKREIKLKQSKSREHLVREINTERNEIRNK